MCFGCSKELSHRDSSFEYPQHMFRLRNNKNNFQAGGFILPLAGKRVKNHSVVFAGNKSAFCKCDSQHPLTIFNARHLETISTFY